MSDFTTDWFTQNIDVWNTVLDDLKGKPIKALELGSYEGRSALWLTENILTHRDATLMCVDSWDGGGELKDHDWNDIFKRFKNNVKNQSKISWTRSDTTSYLTENIYLNGSEGIFDLIYVDASHFAPQTLIDCVLSHLVLKPGGIIIFDDYLIGGLLHTPTTPKTAIDAFMECFAQEYDWLIMGYQVILRKKEIQ